MSNENDNPTGTGTEGTPAPAGGTPPTDRTFTQAEVDAIIKARLAKVGDVDTLRQKAARVDALESELAKEREERELLGKSESEKARLIAERTAAKYQRDLDEERKQRAEVAGRLDQVTARFRDTTIGSQITAGLVAAKAHSGAMADAVAAFMRDVEIESDEEFKVTACTFGGARFQSVEDAARAFLKAKPFYASATMSGGAGITTGGVLGDGKNLSDLSMPELARMIRLPQ